MKRILDPSFRYRPSFDTDVRKTIAAFRRRAGAKRPADAAASAVVHLIPTRRLPK
jgi:hypothetical protein